MGKYEKLIEKKSFGEADAHIDFNELCKVLKRLGVLERLRGRHHIFQSPGVEQMVIGRATAVRKVQAMIKFIVGVLELQKKR